MEETKTKPRLADQIKHLRQRGFELWPGVRVTTKNAEIDTGPEGEERKTPAGTVGWIDSVNHIQADGVVVFSVHFPNGAAVIIDANELADPAQYEVASPTSPRELALYIRHGFSKDYTVLDEPMFAAVEKLANSYETILAAFEARA